MCVFILIIIKFRCAEGFIEAVPVAAKCIAGTADGGSADGGTADGGSADGGTSDGGSADGESEDGGSAKAEGSAKAGEKRLCVYLFLIYAYILIFWAMKRKMKFNIYYIYFINLNKKKFIFQY